MKKVLLVESISLKCNLPENVKPEHIHYFDEVCNQVLPDTFLYFLNNYNIIADGTVYKYLRPFESSFILSNAGYLKHHNWRGLLIMHLMWNKIELPKAKTYLQVHNANKGYYHWLGESIPRLFLLKDKLDKCVLLLPESFRDSFYNESLELLGVNKVEWLKDNTIYKVPLLLFPSVSAQMGSFNPKLMREVRDFFIKKTKSFTNIQIYENIYVSRKKASRRKILNEEEVVTCLGRNGFQTIYFEDYTLLEVVKLCSNARQIVSIHGAGLTNIMFMQPHSKVLELRKHDGGINYFFQSLASVLELDYYLQFCDSDKPDLSVQDADIWVDVTELENNIILMNNQ